jgi:hypothetical protein
MANGILIAAMDFTNVDAGEFNDWYDTEHVPERARVPGFLTLQRWIGVENPRVSLATYDLESVDVLQGPGYSAIGRENSSPWTKRVTSKVTRILRYEGIQTLPGSASAPSGAGGILLVGMTPSAETEAAFNRWYDAEHVPALAAVPGVLSARRFVSSGANATKYVALYHLADPAIPDGAAWKKASGDTPMPQHVRDTITGRLRLVCKSYKGA